MINKPTIDPVLTNYSTALTQSVDMYSGIGDHVKGLVYEKVTKDTEIASPIMPNVLAILTHIQVYPTYDSVLEQVVLAVPKEHPWERFSYTIREYLLEAVIRLVPMRMPDSKLKRICNDIAVIAGRGEDDWCFAEDPTNPLGYIDIDPQTGEIKDASNVQNT